MSATCNKLAILLEALKCAKEFDGDITSNDDAFVLKIRVEGVDHTYELTSIDNRDDAWRAYNNYNSHAKKQIERDIGKCRNFAELITIMEKHGVSPEYCKCNLNRCECDDGHSAELTPIEIVDKIEGVSYDMLRYYWIGGATGVHVRVDNQQPKLKLSTIFTGFGVEIPFGMYFTENDPCALGCGCYHAYTHICACCNLSGHLEQDCDTKCFICKNNDPRNGTFDSGHTPSHGAKTCVFRCKKKDCLEVIGPHRKDHYVESPEDRHVKKKPDWPCKIPRWMKGEDYL